MQKRHLVARCMLMPFQSYRKNLITDLQTSKCTEQLFKFLRIPSLLMYKMELIDLQCNSYLKVKFREVSGKAAKLEQFLRELTPNFPRFSKVLKRVMSLFGSIYLCESLFSNLNFNESKYRSRLTDYHLEAILRVSTASSLKPNVAQLCEYKRCQVSGSKE